MSKIIVFVLTITLSFSLPAYSEEKPKEEKKPRPDTEITVYDLSSRPVLDSLSHAQASIKLKNYIEVYLKAQKCNEVIIWSMPSDEEKKWNSDRLRDEQRHFLNSEGFATCGCNCSVFVEVLPKADFVNNRRSLHFSLEVSQRNPTTNRFEPAIKAINKVLEF
ncbi:hypothetical protein [Candidatus Manganitrophus noduliformans]|uniref:Uncharacterized protein n=1 Tax=Candidatus Manganitrophus noduliformans TaxID=2606439 RepID=A0A7X6IBD5_9BACT|nr:hypothetical protein [Candidatus Manganitrophus noduliformans]NKE71289.1 hypothetical protein [Candidatus Manganitrophus noduliformans]